MQVICPAPDSFFPKQFPRRQITLLSRVLVWWSVRQLDQDFFLTTLYKNMQTLHLLTIYSLHFQCTLVFCFVFVILRARILLPSTHQKEKGSKKKNTANAILRLKAGKQHIERQASHSTRRAAPGMFKTGAAGSRKWCWSWMFSAANMLQDI